MLHHLPHKFYSQIIKGQTSCSCCRYMFPIDKSSTIELMEIAKLAQFDSIVNNQRLPDSAPAQAACLGSKLGSEWAAAR